MTFLNDSALKKQLSPSSSSGPSRPRPLSFRRLLWLALLLVLPACSGVDWFPEYERQPTTPDVFSFEPVSGVDTNSTVTSAAITVSGLTAATSPISVSGGTNSRYSLNGGTPTSEPGQVKNGDQVTVSHTSSASLGSTTTSTLTIGNVTGSFTSTTRTIGDLNFTSLGTFGLYKRAYATVSSIDGIVGTHVISIKDSAGSANALYSIGDADLQPTVFTNVTQTIPILNNQRIFIENLSSATGVTTTLTIDGVEFSVDLSQI